MATTQESQHRELQSKDIPGQIDPDVVIPPSVRAAAARAEAIHRQVYSPAATDQPSPPNGQAAPPGQSEATPAPPARPDFPTVESKPVAGGSSVTPQPQEPPAPTSVPSAAPAPRASEASQQGDSWEHKYASMKGRHDKAQESIRLMADQIMNLQNVLATFSATSPPPDNRTSQQPVPHELKAESLLTPQEISDYGEEFLDVVGKKAREATTPLVRSLQNEIVGLKQQLGNVGSNLAQNSRTKMFTDLDRELPTWRQINENPKFLQWLALPDLYSGAIRHSLLKAAWDRNDTARSLAFFRGFLAEEAVVDPATGSPNGSQAPQVHQPAPGQQQNGKVSLEQYAAPGRAKSAAEIPAEKPLISRSDISKFYAACAAGRYRGNEPERARIEAMIFSAQAEGRITN